MLTKKTTRLKTVRRVHPRRISNKRLPPTCVLVAWGVAMSGASVLCSGTWCRLISLLLCVIPCRGLMDHTCSRSARLYYTTCTNKQDCSFAPLASTFAARSKRTKEQRPDRWLLVPLHRRLRDLCGVPTKA